MMKEYTLSPELEKRYGQFIATAEHRLTAEKMVDIRHALAYAASHLSQHARYDGEPMLDHGVNVAEIAIGEMGLGRKSSAAAIIHDVVRMASQVGDDSLLKATMAEITDLFGREIAGVAMGLANISDIRMNMEDDQAASFREIIVSYSNDPRVILVKLADRLEVMRSIQMFPAEKRRRKSWESMNLYAQIAHKLGLYNLKSELEDLSLAQLEPEAYNHIRTSLKESENERMQFIASFVAPIEAKLQASGIKYHIKSRTKSIYSIWNKMRKQKVPFEGVYDIFAIRIIIDCPKEIEKPQCWTVYSIVSDIYTPNTERLRDWITIPKSNGYESLHTTVSAGNGKWVEIQIRTERMDEVAELGIAAHWRYKGVSQSNLGSDQWLKELREVIAESASDVAEKFDAKLSSNEIFAFTPNGDIRRLSEGATVLDFAFDIHTGLGSTCTGGKVNGKIVPIREVLHNGDIVEILTQKNQTPKADWLNFVTTTKAKGRIKAYLRDVQAKNAIAGREELERKLRNWKIAVSIDEVVAYLRKYYKQKNGTSIYELIATEKLDMAVIRDVLDKWISGEADQERRIAEQEAERNRTSSHTERSSDTLIIDESINNIVYKLAKCCNPIKGDDIFGFVTVASGITIHRSDCPNAKRMREQYPYRVIEAKWRDNATGAFRATLLITASDTQGLASSITDTISHSLKLNLRTISISSRGDGTAMGTVSVEVPSTSVLDTLIYALMKIKGVEKVTRCKN